MSVYALFMQLSVHKIKVVCPISASNALLVWSCIAMVVWMNKHAVHL